jgi:hypothetical protein
MHRRHISLSIAASLSFAAVSFPGVALAQDKAEENYRGTWQQRLACTPDVLRLCGNDIPDVTRIVACLRQNVPQLGSACRAVFEANASVPNPAPPNANGASSPKQGPQAFGPQGGSVNPNVSR